MRERRHAPLQHIDHPGLRLYNQTVDVQLTYEIVDNTWAEVRATGADVNATFGVSIFHYGVAEFAIYDQGAGTVTNPPAATDVYTIWYSFWNQDDNELGRVGYETSDPGQLSLHNFIPGGSVALSATRTASPSSTDYALRFFPDTDLLTLGEKYTFDTAATLGAGQDNYVMTYDHSSGTWGPEASAGGGGAPTLNEQNGNYTLVLGDAGDIIYKASGGAGETITIPANASVAFPLGTVIGITNDGGGDLTIAITTDTLEGTDGTTGSRTLSDNHSATIEKVTSTKWKYTATDGATVTPAEYASFYQSTGGITSISNTALTLNLASTQVNSDSGIFALASNQVTVNKTAVFKINMDNYINSGGTSRSEYSLWLEVDSVEVPGTRHAVYARGYDSGQSTSMSTILSVTSGEVFRMRIQRTDGSGTVGYQDDNGTRLSFQEMI